jgi:peptidoglycan-associated lipoprotein
MIQFSRTLRFACLSAALVLGACTHKQEAVNTAPPPAPPPPPAAAAPVTSSILPGSAEDFRVNVGDTVHFAYNQYNIEDADKGVLGRQAAWLAKYPAVRITVEGHCDERGTREYNLALGARRANAEGVSGQPGRFHGPSGNRVLWQGAPDLHRVQRGLLGAEPPWRQHHRRRREFVTCIRHKKGRGIIPAPLFLSAFA